MAKLNLIDASAGPVYLPEVVDALLVNKARIATKFITPKLVVRATRRRERGKLPTRGNFDLSVTIGRPNFSERQFIRACKKAGEPFPVKKVQLRFLKR